MVRPGTSITVRKMKMLKMKTVILAQAIISFTMCLLMSGYATVLQFGFTMQWLTVWSRAFVMAWPVAFLLSLVVAKTAFTLAHKLLPQQAAH